MLSKEFRQLSAPRNFRPQLASNRRSPARDLKPFGLSMGSGLVVMGMVWAFLFKSRTLGPALLALGATLLLGAIFWPRMLRPVHLVCTAVALIAGRVATIVLLTMLYFLVVTPLGLLARITGKDFLSLRLEPRSASYWRTRSPAGVRSRADYEKQF